jgi:DNA-binding SARP family transcriptional activator
VPSGPGTVEHPAHYGGKDDPYEAIKVIEAWGLGFHLGNALKYIRRAGRKGSRLEDLKKARWSLNSAVCALRKVLRGAETLAVSPIRVVLEGGYYRLSPDVRVSSDRAAFDMRYASGQQFERDGRIREASAEYEKAIELYRGDFLVEDLYEEWTLIERERLVTSYTDMLKRLAVYYMRNGRCHESIWACYRILEKDHCEEGTHHLLMNCFVRLGQRARALRQYRLCEQALRNEYDATPSPEIRAFYTSLSRDRLR